MKHIFFSFLLLVFAICPIQAQQTSAFSFNDMVKIRRVGDPQISPDGKTVAFTIGNVNMAANKTLTQIYTVSIDGSNKKQITNGDKSNSSPRWSPDGTKIAYTSGDQIWTMNADGSGAKQITKISTGAGNPVWSPDGKMIAFSSEVYPDCDSDECNQKRDEAAANNKVKAHVAERLLYRHWTEWRDVKRTHVFVVSSDGGVARDLTPGDFDAPPYAASTGNDYAFSPDSKEIAYLRNPDKVEAVSTNSDIYIVPLNGETPKNITVTNKGYDASPAYTPDGKYIIYRSQATEAFESDRWRIMRFNRNTGENIELTQNFDLQADEFTISPDSKAVLFTANSNGLQPIFGVSIEPNFQQKTTPLVNAIIDTGFNSNVKIAPNNSTLIFVSSSANSPNEIYRSFIDVKYRAASDGVPIKNLSNANPNFPKLAQLENISWTGAENANVHGFLLKPTNFDANKKYPLLVLIHGGPQGAWDDNWGYRWNPQVFANAGYVVFMPNPRGSTGYGQKFVNDISGDWGGKAYVDIMNGVADVLQKNSFIDKTRIGAAGASYGGYMVDWILGHNDDPRFHFKTLVSHAGVYNLESMAGVTEELWFVNHEFNGAPWDNPALYAKWSPNKFVKNFNTPTLVTGGEIDFRVPVDQDYQLFTALQLRNIPSKLIIFPDEGHWIQKPQNSEFWYRNVLDWLGNYLNP